MKPLSLNGKSLAVLLIGQTADGEDDWTVFSGTVHATETVVVLNRDDAPSFEIQTKWFERIKPVGADIKSILLGAEFYLPLSIGPLPEGESAESYISTGLRWPE